MARYRMPLPELLTGVKETEGPSGLRTARQLLSLAQEVGAETWPRQSSVSIRLAGPPDSDQKWLTLFVVTAEGTFYVNWLERSQNIGVSPQVARADRRALRADLG